MVHQNERSRDFSWICVHSWLCELLHKLLHWIQALENAFRVANLNSTKGETTLKRNTNVKISITTLLNNIFSFELIEEIKKSSTGVIEGLPRLEPLLDLIQHMYRVYRVHRVLQEISERTIFKASRGRERYPESSEKFPKINKSCHKL